MGLRDYLSNLAIAQKGVSDFAQTAEDFRKQAIMQQIAAEAPAAIQSGNFAPIAGEAAQAGDLSIIKDLISKQAGAQKKVAFTKDQLVAQGVAPEKAQVLAGLNFDQQKEAISNLETVKSQSLTQQGLNLQDQSQKRLAEKTVQEQRNAAAKDIGDIEKSYRGEERALQKVEESFKTGSLPGDAIVLNFIARNMAGEKGPLAEGDITRLVGKSFAGDYQGALNYVTGLSDPKASPEQRQAYKDLLELARNNYQKWKSEDVGAAFARAVENNPKLAKNGKLDQQLILKAKRLGFEDATLNEDGSISLSHSTVKAPANVINPDTGTPDLDKFQQQINAVKDPKIKDWANAQLKKIKDSAGTGKVVDPEKIKQFYLDFKRMSGL